MILPRAASVFAASVLIAACTQQPTSTPGPTTGVAQSPAAQASPGEGGAPGRELSSDEWTIIASAQVALTEVAVAAFDGRLWVAGGLQSRGGAVNTVQVYDPSIGQWEFGPNLPEAVHHSTLVASDDSLYLIGGYVGGQNPHSSAVWRLDRGVDSWTEETPLPEGRAAGAAAWDGARLVYGGGVGPAGITGDVLALEDGTWRLIGQLQPAREHLAAASDGDGRTWFLGGRIGGLEANVASVSLVEADSVTDIGEVPTPRGGVGGFWSPAHGACLAGGEQPGGTLPEVECIDAEGAITTLPPLAEGRHGIGAGVIDGVAYVALGGPEPALSVSTTLQALLLEER